MEQIPNVFLGIVNWMNNHLRDFYRNAIEFRRINGSLNSIMQEMKDVDLNQDQNQTGFDERKYYTAWINWKNIQKLALSHKKMDLEF